MESPTVDADQLDDTNAVQSPSQAVVRAVAQAADVDQIELPPLFDAIDPDALDALFAPGPTASRPAGSIRFTYAGHPVRVAADGTVDVGSAAE